MKFSFSNKSNNTKHRLARPKNSLLHRIGRDSIADWVIMLFVGAFIVLVYISVGYMKYTASTATIDSSVGVAVQKTPIRFNDERLDTLLQKYESKQNVQSSMVSGRYIIPNPGL